MRTFDAKALENNQAVDALPDEEGSRTLVGCGTAFADQEVLIVDPETMTRCPDGRVGEIWVAGPSVAQGYWRHAEETAKTFLAYLKDSGRGPYLRTGDLGFLNDGELFVTGRLKDLIIIRGRNHYPQDIEQTVEKAHPLLRPSSSAVFMIDVGGRERLGVVAEIERGRNRIAARTRRSLRRHSKDGLRGARNSDGGHRADQGGQHSQNIQRENPAPCLPQRIFARQRFGNGCPMAQLGSRNVATPASASSAGAIRPPRSSATALPAALAASSNGHGSQPVGDRLPPMSSEVATVVMEHITRVAKERAKGLTLDSNILEMSMDSLERMEIVAALEDTFGGRFPEEVLPDMILVRDVVAAVEKYLGKTPRKRTDGADRKKFPPRITASINSPNTSRSKKQWQLLVSTGAMNPYFKVHERVIDDTTVIGGREAHQLVELQLSGHVGRSGFE